MRDEHRGCSRNLPNSEYLFVQLHAREFIDGTARFVQQQDIGTGYKRPRECDSHSHSTRELRRQPRLRRRKSSSCDHLIRTSDSFVARDSRQFQWKRDIVRDISPRKQSRVLKADRKIFTCSRIRTAIWVDQFHRARCCAIKSRGNAKERCLAATTWPDDCSQTTSRN